MPQKGWDLVAFMRDFHYSCFLHCASAFNSKNHRGNSANTRFGDACDVGLLFVPDEKHQDRQHLLIGDPDFMMVVNVDDLVKGMVRRPQYRISVAPELADRSELRLLSMALAERERQLDVARADLTERSGVLSAQLSQRDEQANRLRADLDLQFRLSSTLSATLAETERQLKGARADLVERSGALSAQVLQRDEQINWLRADLDLQVRSASALSVTLAEAERQLKAARAELAERNEALSAQISQRDEQISHLRADIDVQIRSASSLSAAFVGTERQLETARAELAERTEGLSAQLSQRDEQINSLRADLDVQLRSLRSELNHTAEALSAEISQREQRIAGLSTELGKVHGSRSWRFTKPLRILAHRMREAGRRLRRPWTLPIVLLPTAVRRRISLWRQARLVRRSDFFDPSFYLRQYQDVAAASADPVVHYLLFGASEGRDPSLRFDTTYYLERNPDVRAGGVNPLVHFLLYGKAEQRDFRSVFDRSIGAVPLTSPTTLMSTPLDRVEGSSVATMKTAGPSGRLLADQEVSGKVPDDLRVLALLNEETKRSATRASDAETWGDYEIVRARIEQADREYRQKLAVAPARLFHVSPERVETVAGEIHLPQPLRPVVSIIVPAFNGIATTIECLSTLAKHTPGPPYEVILVDDASTDDTPHVLSRVKGLRYLRNEQNLGFVETCNHGAAVAKGEYLVFLNNDTQPTSDWLSPLVETFRKIPNVGAVGCKLVYPSGHLQEAGAAVNCDLTTVMVGVNDDPSRARYNYLREVEYCSGACLVVKRERFASLGGFSGELAPSYYEDVDLQLRLRQEGLRVYYNPDSVVIHHLSVTNQDGPGSTKRRQLLKNSQRLRELWGPRIDREAKVRLIAFYFPQFHPFAENEFWWGKGFTEWTNVSKARPNFVGHYQPHLPGDMGFYDLRVPDAMDRQAELAKAYGIHGFCFFYYWFAGKRLMQGPLERILETGKPDIPFCLSWANENWSRRWDGGHAPGQVMIAQQHSKEDDRAVIRDLMRYFRHRNYIRVHDKPMLLVYRVNLFPDIARTAEIWRELCFKEGIGEIYLVRVESFEHAISTEPPKTHGFDAAVEYPPHQRSAPFREPLHLLNGSFGGAVNDYRDFAVQSFSYKDAAYTHFRGVMPSWDNTPRRQDDGVVFFHATPGAYQAWLETAIQYTIEQNVGDERLVFVNAWNEWAEGAHLEPDRRFGRAYLQATQNALSTQLYSKD